MLLRKLHKKKIRLIILLCGLSLLMMETNFIFSEQNKHHGISLKDNNNYHYLKLSNKIQHGTTSFALSKKKVATSTDNITINVKSSSAHRFYTKYNSFVQAGRYFLVALLTVRIYEYDKPKWTTTELDQWIRYMFYAGVEHIYLYDNYKFMSESLQEWCQENYGPSLITYHDWSKYHPYKLSNKVKGYNHAIATYGNISKWQIAFDMDEYPFSVNDLNPGFLKRFLLKQVKLTPKVSEYCFENYLFLGQPKNRTYVLERFLRRTPEPANYLVKPLYMSECIKTADVHHNRLKCGSTMNVDSDVMRMNHYWGARLQNWGEDTPDIINRTVVDESGLEMAKRVYI